ncbi:MAG: DUF6105 family protein [Rhizobiaceae bacterium]
MMRTLLILWLTPIFLLTSWYGLSYNDINFGTTVLSRELHDLVFAIYGKMLGIAPELIPLMVLKAIAFDSLLVLAIIAYRMRKSWWPSVSAYFRHEKPQVLAVSDPSSPAE